MPDPAPRPPVVWGRAESRAERDEVYAFRYAHYYSGIDAPGVDHALRRVYLPHDDESILLTGRDTAGKLLITGTGTSAAAQNLPPEWRKLFRLDRLAPLGLDTILIYSRLVSLPERRGGTLFLEFFKYSARYFTERGHACTIHYCAPDLVPLYERLGYRRYAEGYTLSSGLYRIPMILVAADTAYMERVNPAFLQAVRGLAPAGDVTRILAALPELAPRRDRECGASPAPRRGPEAP